MLRSKTGMSVQPLFASKEFSSFFKRIDNVERPPRVNDCGKKLKTKLNIYRTWLSILISEQAVELEKFKIDLKQSLETIK